MQPQPIAADPLLMTPEAIRAGLNSLQPNVPWAHHFDLGHGIETVMPDPGNPQGDKDKFYRKAVGLNALGDLFPAVLRSAMRRDSFVGLTCLDIGSAEGAHSIRMAEAGATEVIGIEGRQLYVDRASFVARVKGLDNVAFKLGDVRKIDAAQLGTFDFVLCSGLLHHLDKDAFLATTQMLFDVTGDTLMLYTHVANDFISEKFKLLPTDPVDGKYAGMLYREHKEGTTEDQRKAKVRASLDNEFSFWAREESLMKRFVDVGFKHIVKLYEPAFVGTFTERVFRGIWILRREAP